ncbi:MAG: hypothetical protein PHI59_00075 [Candidatus Omnitrophica bacterium]|nr:hypothetical protein [Candidatus Omnitrophota bacterium]
MKNIRKKWGYYNILLKGKGYWVKRLVLKGGSTSLQTHRLRSEIWIIKVPVGCKHKLSGKGDVLEIALGDPRERDIVRYK